MAGGGGDQALRTCCQVGCGVCEEHREIFGLSICKDRDGENGRGSTLDENVSSPIRTR